MLSSNVIENSFETLENFAKRVINIYKKNKQPTTAKFNWIEVEIIWNSDISTEQLIDMFQKRLLKNQQNKNKNLQILITNLSQINFDELEDILDLIYNFEREKQIVWTSFDNKQIINTFTNKNFEANKDINYDFSTENEVIYAKYLIGLFLYHIKYNDKISEALPHLINIWKQKFGKEAKKTKKRFENIKI